jgi:hypothetical protein
MFAFTSKYALALYEAVCLRGNLRVCEQAFSVEDFRALLGVEKERLRRYARESFARCGSLRQNFVPFKGFSRYT